ncbi:MAG: ECF transporter S component [Clostridia bacterium]|nr:ECF transporter S component [Clostridia bacterium]
MKKLSTRELVLLSVLIALIIFLCFITSVVPMPSGLNITFSLIPLALAAIALGPVGGAIAGGVFGLVSFLQCFGLIGTSGMGVALFNEARTFKTVALLFVQRVFPRLIDGVALAYVFRAVRKHAPISLAFSVTGVCAALINTLLFMAALVWLFGSYEYMQGKVAGRAFFVYLVASVGINGLVELVVTPILVSSIGYALYKAKYIDIDS